MKPIFSFGVVSDVQYSVLPTHNPEQRPANLGIKKLSEAVDEFNNHDLDFVINLGDLIDRDERSFPPILEVLNKCNAPVWHALGNHDFCGPEYDYGHKQQALDAYGMTEESRYYTKEVKDWKLIVLDTNEVGTIEYPEGTPEFEEGEKILQSVIDSGKINGMSWNGGLSDKQLEWLSEQIDTAGDKPVIVFAHHSVYPEHQENLLNFEQVLEILDRQDKVKAFINGHNHAGDYGTRNNIHYWTIEGMMDYADKTAYAVVDVYEDKLEIKGFGRVLSRSLPI